VCGTADPPLPLHQVAAVPKAKAKKEESQEVQPQTWEEKATETLGQLLSAAAKARTLSIKLGNLEYAAELSKQLLSHASLLEDFYKELQAALEKKEGDKILRKILDRIQETMNACDKAEARFLSDCV